MREKTISRRDFLVASGAVLESTWVATNLPAIRAAGLHARAAVHGRAKVQILTGREARDLDAIAAQIFPTDDTPGAREAGVVHFLDRAFGSFAADSLEAIRAGLEDLQATVEARHPEAAAFADLTFEQQTTVLHEIEESDFFAEVRTLTIAGMFALPSYGGNRDEIGWAILGFDPSPVFGPPFGYFDRGYVDPARGGP